MASHCTECLSPLCSLHKEQKHVIPSTVSCMCVDFLFSLKGRELEARKIITESQLENEYLDASFEILSTQACCFWNWLWAARPVVLQNQPVANTGSSLCGLSLSQAALWPFLFEKRRATLPSGEQSVSASFHKAQSVVGSFLWKFTLSVLPLKSPYGIV